MWRSFSLVAATGVFVGGGAVFFAGCAAGGGARSSGGGAPGQRRSLFGSSGGTWSIRCVELTGEQRTRNIAQLAETLKRTPGIRSNDVYVFDSGSGKTGLYYGRYRRTTDPKTGRRDMPAQMRSDLDLLKQLGDESGRRYFLQALPARIPTHDVGDPAWDLNRVRGMYTLQVGIFEPTDGFIEYKQAAADYCKLLREKGYEAYYRHTDASSIVTVGLFGEGAVYLGQDKKRYYSNEVTALQRKELLEYNRVNGGVMYVNQGDGTKLPVPSFLVLLPESQRE